ncbi:DUF5666 domain-containing protein [Streptomyces cyaneofuscatus]|uniref:DUF5666 domain-containing protein n=1 Tax=Streptomyces cyaneofuscatus TaxID=66883 RepID=UPI0034015663
MPSNDQSPLSQRRDGEAEASLPPQLLSAPDHSDDLDDRLTEGRHGPGRITLALGAAILVVCGVAGGIGIEKAMAPAPDDGSRAARQGAPQEGAQQRGSGGAGGRADGGAVVGTVDRVEDGTLFVKTSEGETVRVKTTGDTRVQVTEEGTTKDLASGQTVAVSGERADDGSLSATVISQGTTPRGSGRGGTARNGDQEGGS